LLAVHHPRAAVAAEVVEGPHLAVLPAHDDGALAKDVEGQPVAGRGDVVDMARHLPVVQEDVVAFQPEQRLAVIGPGRQAGPVPVVRNGQRFHRKLGHASPSSIRSRTHLWKRCSSYSSGISLAALKAGERMPRWFISEAAPSCSITSRAKAATRAASNPGCASVSAGKCHSATSRVFSGPSGTSRTDRT